MLKTPKIYVAGHTGLVGSAILKKLQEKGYTNLICPSHAELDLTQQQAVADFFSAEMPEYVLLAAAKVGGILANNHYRADFIYQNLAIQNNIIHQSYVHGVKKLVFLGSTCIYPKQAPQPMPEDCLLTSGLEYTNEPYAIAKIAGLKMCEAYNLQYGTNFISAMPCNLYGPKDNFDLKTGHVLAALMRKIHLAKQLSENNLDAVVSDLKMNSFDQASRYLDGFGVTASQVEIWGSGQPRREFMYSEDLADAIVFLLEHCDFQDTYAHDSQEIRNTHINIGTGIDISIAELAKIIKQVIGFKGEFVFNHNQADGTAVKRTDPSKLHALGWHHQIALTEGISKLYRWYLNQ